MDTQQLSYFLALCDALNYTTAAERCFITRQAMRQCVQALEAAYGLPLIENRKNRLHLTPAGALLKEKAQPVVNAYAALEAALHACRSPHALLRVGVSRSLIPFYAPELVSSLERLPAVCPGVTLETTIMTSDEVLCALQLGKLDAGLVVDTGSLPIPLRRTVLREDALRILLCAGHPLAGRSQLRLADLDGLPLNVMSEPSMCFYALDSALARAGVHPEYRIVPDFYDVGCSIRDNRTLAIDRGEPNDIPQFVPDRVLTLEDDAFHLYTTLFTAESPSPAVKLLISFLCDQTRHSV